MLSLLRREEPHTKPNTHFPLERRAKTSCTKSQVRWVMDVQPKYEMQVHISECSLPESTVRSSILNRRCTGFHTAWGHFVSSCRKKALWLRERSLCRSAEDQRYIAAHSGVPDRRGCQGRSLLHSRPPSTAQAWGRSQATLLNKGCNWSACDRLEQNI